MSFAGVSLMSIDTLEKLMCFAQVPLMLIDNLWKDVALCTSTIDVFRGDNVLYMNIIDVDRDFREDNGLSLSTIDVNRHN